MQINIAIIGYGIVGRALEAELLKERGSMNAANIKIFIKDIDGWLDCDSCDSYDSCNSCNSCYNLPKLFNIAFVCVNTDSNEDGSTDLSCVEHAVANINSEIIVVKSAVPVGTCSMLSLKYKKQIVCSPEFYGNTLHSPKELHWIILGGHRDVCAKVAQFYYKIKPSTFRIRFTDWNTAELTKYTENTYLALLVTFWNEINIIGKQYGINYEELRECVLMDERISPTHSFVFDDTPFWDSHCLNKDVDSLIHQGKGKAKLITAMRDINIARKARKARKK